MSPTAFPSSKILRCNIEKLDSCIARFAPKVQEVAILAIAVIFGETDGCVLNSYYNGPLHPSGSYELLYCDTKLFSKDKGWLLWIKSRLWSKYGVKSGEVYTKPNTGVSSLLIHTNDDNNNQLIKAINALRKDGYPMCSKMLLLEKFLTSKDHLVQDTFLPPKRKTLF